jgi:hypothetical protein
LISFDFSKAKTYEDLRQHFRQYESTSQKARKRLLEVGK